jgi:septum formation topological specificity factor MinE
MNDIFNDIFNGTFNENPTHNNLKDRMKTLIAKAKQGTKQQFIEALAADYILIMKGL